MKYFRIYNGQLIIATIAAESIEAAERRADEMFGVMWNEIREV